MSLYELNTFAKVQKSTTQRKPPYVYLSDPNKQIHKLSFAEGRDVYLIHHQLKISQESTCCNNGFANNEMQKKIYGLLLGLVCHFASIRTLTFHRPESDFSGNGGWTALPQHDMDVIGGIKDAKGHR